MSYQKVHIRAHLLETQASKEIIFSGKCFSIIYFTKTEYSAHTQKKKKRPNTATRKDYCIRDIRVGSSFFYFFFFFFKKES